MSSRHRNGFTLIELVAAAVLAAMMMVGLMSIVWSASRDLRQFRSNATTSFPTTILEDRLRTDLQNARGMQWGIEGIVLHGFVTRDPSTREPVWIEGRVVYRTVATASGRTLVRAQNGQSPEPMWVGVDRFMIESMEQADPEDGLIPLPEAGGLPETPGVFRVTLVDQRGRILWREVIHHHGN